MILSESTLKKSPIIRVEVALRDNYGIVYDTIYKTMADNQFNFIQTYETLIYTTEQDVKMNESFYIRIPTKSLETLSKLYIVFLVQTLLNTKDSRGSKIKANNFANETESLSKSFN